MVGYVSRRVERLLPADDGLRAAGGDGVDLMLERPVERNVLHEDDGQKHGEQKRSHSDGKAHAKAGGAVTGASCGMRGGQVCQRRG